MSHDYECSLGDGITTSDGSAVNTEILGWLEELPTYNGTLKVFNGDFKAHDFIQAIGNTTRYIVIESADGPVSIVQGALDAADRSQRSDYFDYHTDGFYLPEPPTLFILACENPGEADSKTAFVDSKEVLRRVEAYIPILEQLSFVYIGKDLKKRARPLVERHPTDGLPITNLVTRGYVEPVVDEGSVATLPDFRFINEAMTALYGAIEDSVSYIHSWTQGDVLLADNHTYLHARLAELPDTARRLSRIWLHQTVEFV